MADKFTPDATKDKAKVRGKQGNDTITDVSSAALKADAQRVATGKNTKAHSGTTVAGDGLRPASSGSPDVAPIVKQNQNTDLPAISMTPPVYGHAGITDAVGATGWELATAKLEARYGKDFLATKTKAQVDDLREAEYRRLHNGSLDEDLMTAHASDAPLEG